MTFTRISILVVLVALFHHSAASPGDQSAEFKACVPKCIQDCENPDWNGYRFNVFDNLVSWDCDAQCQYSCMWKDVERRQNSNLNIVQYYGKWPFLRLFGMQELASVVFSVLNGYMHYKGMRRLGRVMPKKYWLRNLLMLVPIININAWVWSSVFHVRDIGWTEKMDYFSAGLVVLGSTCIVGIRVFKLSGFTRTFWTLLCVSAYIAHIWYLTSTPRFDYEYNMLANVVVGSTHSAFWLYFTFREWSQRRKHLPLLLISVFGLSLAMCLELLDFPPIAWLLDAHGLWHATTVPLVAIYYHFLVSDVQWEVANGLATSSPRGDGLLKISKD